MPSSTKVVVMSQNTLAESSCSSLPENLRTLRKGKGWSQTEFAKKIGVHLTHVSRIETGKYLPTIDFVVRAASALGISIDELVSDTDNITTKVHLIDQELEERLQLLEELNQEERNAILTVMDSMLTKHRIRKALDNQTAS